MIVSELRAVLCRTYGSVEDLVSVTGSPVVVLEGGKLRLLLNVGEMDRAGLLVTLYLVDRLLLRNIAQDALITEEHFLAGVRNDCLDAVASLFMRKEYDLTKLRKELAVLSGTEINWGKYD